jgi:hypothetical protein
MMDDEPVAGNSGAEEPEWGASLTPDGSVGWREMGPQPTPSSYYVFDPLAASDLIAGFRPDKYYPDGKPILSDELLPATDKWALLLEQRDSNRIVGQTCTLYGEKLSTVWLGLDHNYSRTGPPLIFETMLFAPARKKVTLSYILAVATKTVTLDEEAAYDHQRAYIAKHYPHDQLQLRYSTRAEAEDSYQRLMLQCLIPPRWRHFLLGRVYGDPTWLNYDEEITEWWT